jgi:hypothetical protein
MNNEWAENRTVDFNLWIAGIGALAGKNSSLDARLSSQPETSLVVVNLLILLKIFLERCKALGEFARPRETPFTKNFNSVTGRRA